MKLLFYICVLLSIDSYAERSWYHGSLVLNDQSVLAGEISVESRYDVVLFRHENVVDVYPAHKIQLIRFYDARLEVNRKFISLRGSSTFFQAYQLYEVVVSGEVSLLRREATDVAVTKEEHEALGYRYLVRYKGELSSLKQFRSKVYPKIRHIPGVELPSYLKANHLNPNNESNAVRIIQYYNQAIGSIGDVAVN